MALSLFLFHTAAQFLKKTIASQSPASGPWSYTGCNRVSSTFTRTCSMGPPGGCNVWCGYALYKGQACWVRQVGLPQLLAPLARCVCRILSCSSLWDCCFVLYSLRNLQCTCTRVYMYSMIQSWRGEWECRVRAKMTLTFVYNTGGKCSMNIVHVPCMMFICGSERGWEGGRFSLKSLVTRPFSAFSSYLDTLCSCTCTCITYSVHGGSSISISTVYMKQWNIQTAGFSPLTAFHSRSETMAGLPRCILACTCTCTFIHIHVRVHCTCTRLPVSLKYMYMYMYL